MPSVALLVTPTAFIPASPFEFTLPLQDKTAVIGDTITFQCETNKPAEQYQWFKGSQCLQSDERCLITSDKMLHLLIIENIEPDDMGEYSFREANSVTSANLTVKGL